MSKEASFLEEKYIGRMGKMYNVYLKGWLPKDKTATLIDIGCGEGTLICALKRDGYNNIQGVDLSRDKVARAQRVEARVAESDAVEFLQDKHKAFERQ